MLFDIPVDNVQVVQEYVVNESQAVFGAYQMSEVDLAFLDALPVMCSGDASSGPAKRKV